MKIKVVVLFCILFGLSFVAGSAQVPQFTTHRVDVTTGISDGVSVEVTGNLKEGDRILISSATSSATPASGGGFGLPGIRLGGG